MAGDYRITFPLVAARQNTLGEKQPIAISETLSVVNGYIRLKEVPHFDPAEDMRVVVAGYEEVLSTPAEPLQYMVNYITGRVYFSPVQNGATVRVDYYGLGSLVATDEINWLWQMATEKNSFIGLEDTANELTPRSFLRVNHTGTKIEMADATVGRSQSTATMVDVGVGEEFTVPGTVHDIFRLYRKLPPTAVTEDCPMEYTEGPTGAAEFDGTVWKLTSTSKSSATLTPAAPAAPADISKLTGIQMLANTPVGATVRVILKVGDGYFRASSSGLEYLGNALPGSVKGYGCSVFDVNSLLPSHVAPFTGMPVSAFVYMESNDAAESPEIAPHITLMFERGGGFELVEHSGSFNTAAEEWTLATQAAGGPFLLAQGSGHDDVICASESVEFESVAPGESVAVNAPVHAAINVLLSKRLPDDTAVYPTVAPGWKTGDDAALSDFARVAGQCVARTLAAAKGVGAVPATPYSMFNSLSYPLTQVVSGGPGVTTPAGSRVVRGLLGPALYMGTQTPIALNDNWMLYHSGTSALSANRSIGGWFKWVSGSPIIISSSQGWWDGNLNQLYVVLTSNRIICYLGYTSRTVYYTPGTWVWVGLTNIWSWHEDAKHDDKGCTLIVNAGMYGMSHSLWDVPTHRVTVPGYIGDASPNLSSSGYFLVDTALSYRRNLSQTDVNTIVNGARTARAEAVIDEYSWHKAATVFPAPASGPYISARETNAAWETDTATRHKVFWEKAGVIRTWDTVTQQVITVSLAQPPEMLYALGCPANELKNIPVAAMQDLSDGSVLRTLTKYTAGTDTDMPGFPDNITLASENYAKSWRLARPGVDVAAAYIDDTKQWRITNTSADTTSVRVAMLGSAANDAVRPVRFNELADGVSLFDEVPRALVSSNGTFQKRTFVHPFLIGGP